MPRRRTSAPPPPAVVVNERLDQISGDDLKRVELLAGVGVTEATIARAILMSPATFRRRKGTHPELVSALDKGKDRAHTAVTRALFTRAVAGDVRAIQWWEMTRMGINPRVVVSTPAETVDPFAELTPEQKAEKLAGIVAGHIGPARKHA